MNRILCLICACVFGFTSGAEAQPKSPEVTPAKTLDEAAKPSEAMMKKRQKLRKLLRNNNFTEGEVLIAEILKETPGDEFTNLQLANVYVKTGRSDKAMTLLNGMKQTHPESMKVYYNQSSFYFQAGKREEAIAVLDEGVKQFPDEASFYVMRGDIRKVKGSASEQDFLKALEVNPTHRAALNNLAVLYTSQNNYEKALKTLESLVALSQKGASGRFNLASTYYALGRVSEAQAVYKKMLERRPKDPYLIAHYGLGFLLSQKLEAFDALMLEYPSVEADPDIQYVKGLRSLFKGELEKAETLLKVSEPKMRGGVFGMMALVELYSRQKAFEPAEAMMKKLKSRDASVRSLANCYEVLLLEAQGKVAEAKSKSLACLSEQPNYKGDPASLVFLLRMSPTGAEVFKKLLIESPDAKPTPVAEPVRSESGGCGCTAVDSKLPGFGGGLLVLTGLFFLGRRTVKRTIRRGR